MKRTFFLMVLCFALSLAGCGGVSQSEYDALVEENSSLQAQVEELQAEVEPETEADSEIDSFEAHLKELQAEAEKIAAESFEITSGDFYDSVIEIYPHISLTDMGEDVSISISLNHENELDDSTMFFSVINKILETSKLEDYYSGVTFTMYVDDSMVSMFTLLNYSSSSSFTASSPVVFKDNYMEPIDTLYAIGFSGNDIANNFEKELEALSEQYN